MVESMKQVSENYLSTEKGYADDWAAYISSCHMTAEEALDYIRNADMLIIGGTSLVVYPAAGLVRYYRGHKLVVINKGAVGADLGADLVIDGPIGQVFSQV